MGSKNLVYQLFFTFLCLACGIEESFFNVSEKKFYQSLEEKINSLKFSPKLKEFFAFILIRNKLDTLPSFYDLQAEILMRKSSQDDSFLSLVANAHKFNFQINMEEFFTQKQNSLTSLQGKHADPNSQKPNELETKQANQVEQSMENQERLSQKQNDSLFNSQQRLKDYYN